MKLHTRVTNRVAFINKDSDTSQWKYIGSKFNAADDALLGVTADVFILSESWIRELNFFIASVLMGGLC